MKLSIFTLSLVLQAHNVSAFTTPSTKARAFSSCSRLSAETDMSSLLREYSSSVVSPSASKIAASIPPPPVEVTIPSPEVLTPPPEAISTIEATTTASMNDLAAAAQSAAADALAAAEKATTAASELATPAMKATLSATAGFDTFQFRIPESMGAIAPVESGKTPTLLQYLKYGSGAADDSTDNFAAAKEKIELLGQNLFGTNLGDVFKDIDLSNPKEMSENIAGSVANFDINSLNLEKYGAWYLSGILFFVALQQRGAATSSAKEQYEKELSIARAKADEAAEAASVAAAGAKAAKELVEKMPKATPTLNKSAELLESTKYEQMRIEKEMMRKEMERMIQETALLRQQLSEISKQKVSSKDEVKLRPAVKEVMQRDPEEDARILQILKDMDESNASKKKVTKKKRTVKKAAPVAKDTTAEVPSKKSVKKAKKAAKKTKKTVEQPVEVASVDNPWASLSDSTLKRKTIQQLTAYLEERNVKVTDDSGKNLKKAELVSVVQSL